MLFPVTRCNPQPILILYQTLYPDVASTHQHASDPAVANTERNDFVRAISSTLLSGCS